MANSIKDGTGIGKLAKVDRSNRLYTRSVAETLQNEAALAGEAFFVGSGAISLTSANPSAIFYFKNNEDRAILVSTLTFQSKESAGGTSGLYDAIFYKNATGLTSSTDGAQLNVNLGSANTLDGTIEKGAEGSAVNGGTPVAAFMLRHGQLEEVASSVVIPKGASIGVVVTPPPGNTSLTVSFSIRCFIIPEDLT